MRIVIPDDYQDAVRGLDCFSKLAEHQVMVYHDSVKDIAVLAARFRSAEALVLIRERTAITDPLLALLPNLQLISQTGRGINHLDLAACTRRGIVVTVGGGAPHAPAELTWGLVLAALRQIPQAIATLRAGKWDAPLGVGLYGHTLGILGYGKIGTLVAGYGRAFGMKVLVWGREGSLERAQVDGFEVAASQRDLFQRADVLSLHVKLVNETRGIVTAADLAAMKPAALLVNTSRAELIQAGALEAALRAGRPGFAAVDVYETEPTTDHPLLRLDNVIATPHAGYLEKDTYEYYFGTAFDQVLAFAAGAPVGVINPEALERR